MNVDEDLAVFISRFLPLSQEGNEKVGKCCFCEDAERSFRVGTTWRCFNCNSHDIYSGDQVGFYACWTNSSRQEAIEKLGNGAGLRDTQPIPQVPLRKLPFWG